MNTILTNNHIVRKISRLIAVLLAVITIIGTFANSASAANALYVKIYNTQGYKQVCANTKVYTTPTVFPKSVYITLKTGSLIKTTGTVWSAGKRWCKVQIGTATYYILNQKVMNCSKTYNAQLYIVTKNNAALRTTPYETGNKESLPKSTLVRVVGKVTNKYGNTWYEVIDQQSSAIRYIYSGNVSSNISVNGAMRLDQSSYFQSRNNTCSAAATLSVLRYAGLLTNTSDVNVQNTTKGYVGGIVNKLNAEMGSGTYTYATFTSVSSYERAIRQSLIQGSSVIARVKFTRGYFNYSSNGHYTTIVGIYTQNGETWLELRDSYVNRFTSNSYANKYTGVVRIPLKTLYNYGTYGGRSSVYLIYNP